MSIRETSLFNIRLGFRIVMLVLAMTMMAAAPAAAQVTQETEQEGESGEVDQSGEISSEGDNSNQCVGLQTAANSGNAQNVTDISQYRSRVDEIELEDSGAEIDVSPENSTECEQEVNQAASAAAPEAAAAPAPAAPKAAPAPAAAPPKPVAPAPAPGAKPAPAAKAEGGAEGGGAAKAKAGKQLPKTGGTGGTVIALAAGALLIGGGLVAIRGSRFFRR